MLRFELCRHMSDKLVCRESVYGTLRIQTDQELQQLVDRNTNMKQEEFSERFSHSDRCYNKQHFTLITHSYELLSVLMNLMYNFI